LDIHIAKCTKGSRAAPEGATMWGRPETETRCLTTGFGKQDNKEDKNSARVGAGPFRKQQAAAGGITNFDERAVMEGKPKRQRRRGNRKGCRAYKAIDRSERPFLRVTSGPPTCKRGCNRSIQNKRGSRCVGVMGIQCTT